MKRKGCVGCTTTRRPTGQYLPGYPLLTPSEPVELCDACVVDMRLMNIELTAALSENAAVAA